MTLGSRARRNTQVRPCVRLSNCWREPQHARRWKQSLNRTPAFNPHRQVKEAIVSGSILKTQERLFTIPEVGAVLQVSEKTVRRWIAAEELPAAKLGNQWRIRPRDLDDFVRDRLVR